jgi:hypothetical protein
VTSLHGILDGPIAWGDGCRHNHPAGSPCPVVRGTWLVLSTCWRCQPKTGRYCSRHGGYAPPDPEPATVTPAELAALGEEERRRIGGDV